MEITKSKSAVTIETVQNYINDLAEQRFYADLKAAISAIEDTPILRDLKITIGSEELFLTNRCRPGADALTISGYFLNQVLEHMETFSNIAELKSSLFEQYVKQETDIFLDKVAGSSEDYPF